MKIEYSFWTKFELEDETLIGFQYLVSRVLAIFLIRQ